MGYLIRGDDVRTCIQTTSSCYTARPRLEVGGSPVAERERMKSEAEGEKKENVISYKKDVRKKKKRGRMEKKKTPAIVAFRLSFHVLRNNKKRRKKKNATFVRTGRWT